MNNIYAPPQASVIGSDKFNTYLVEEHHPCLRSKCDRHLYMFVIGVSGGVTGLVYRYKSGYHKDYTLGDITHYMHKSLEKHLVVESLSKKFLTTQQVMATFYNTSVDKFTPYHPTLKMFTDEYGDKRVEIVG